MLDPLDYLTEVERQILRYAITDTGRGIYASPLIGGSYENVGRYLTEGGELLPSHDWRSVWRAVVQLLEREPHRLGGKPPTRAEVAKVRRMREESADLCLEDALRHFKANDWERALKAIDSAEMVAPLYRPEHRTYDDLRRFVCEKRDALAGAK